MEHLTNSTHAINPLVLREICQSKDEDISHKISIHFSWEYYGANPQRSQVQAQEGILYQTQEGNSQYVSNRDKLYLTGVVVTCSGMMCSMNKVGEAVDVSYFVLEWSLALISIWANLGWHCLNGCTTTSMKKAHSCPVRLEG